jgi:hypothetical protein
MGRGAIAFRVMHRGPAVTGTTKANMTEYLLQLKCGYAHHPMEEGWVRAEDIKTVLLLTALSYDIKPNICAFPLTYIIKEVREVSNGPSRMEQSGESVD